MNNSVIFENTVAGAEDSIKYAIVKYMMSELTWDVSTNAKRCLTMFNADRRMPENYVALDKEGFSLLDDTLVFAQSDSDAEDWIGMVPSSVTNSNGTYTTKPVIEMWLDDYYTYDKGITLFFPDDGLYYSMKIVFGYRSSISSSSTTTWRTVNVVTNEAEYYTTFTEPSSDVNLIQITFNGIYSEYTSSSNNTPVENALYRFYGLSLGSNFSISESSIIGDIICYHEMPAPVDDVPIGTCEMTIITEETPFIGEVFRISSDNFVGKYNVETFERVANNIWQIHGVDDLNILDSYTYEENETYGVTPAGIENITNVNIEYTDQTATYTGWLTEDETTCRQWLAEYIVLQHVFFTTFNCSNGIKMVAYDTADSKTNPITISDENILGEAVYRDRDTYLGTEFNVTVDVGGVETEFDQYQRSTFPKARCLAGWYTNKSNTFIAKSSTSSATVSDFSLAAENIRQFVNGADVTAMIVYNNEQLGDWVNISTPYDGTVFGIIKSIELHLNHADTANIVVREANSWGYE